MKLSELESPKSLKKKKRVGRGNGSGHGTTSGRGTKGQLSRSGGNTRIGFEGGQMPLQRRVPHLKGFKNLRKKVFNVVNVGDLEEFKEGTTIDYKLLKEKGLIMKKDSLLKVLGNGELSKKLTVKANAFSGSASAKIEKAGGKAEVI
ncbi:MAG: 50S ribosomal protein L15 [Actinobacteria bacterium]|nr:50S ribosomal protein L15 [Actinomycetota bacterium]